MDKYTFFFTQKITKIYIIRHGKVENAGREIFNGIMDIELNKDGKIEAEKLSNFFEDKDISVIFTSPLKRCIYTAERIKEKIKARIIMDKRIKEKNFGIFQGCDWEEIKRKFPGESKQYVKDFFHFRIPNGESSFDVRRRLSSFVEDIKNIKKNIVIVSHGTINRIIIGEMFNLPSSFLISIAQDYGGINIIETDGERYVLRMLNGRVR
jgi:broad specificity phosphatase PhoE